MGCKAITWVSTLDGSIGIGVFDDGYGKVSIRAAMIAGIDPTFDTLYVANWGGRIPEDELERLLAAAKEARHGQ